MTAKAGWDASDDLGWGQDAGRYVMSVAVAMTGVDAHRIRKYEAAGLVTPARTAGGQRLFSDRDVSRIRESAGLEAEGINLKGSEVIIHMKKREELNNRGEPR